MYNGRINAPALLGCFLSLLIIAITPGLDAPGAVQSSASRPVDTYHQASKLVLSGQFQQGRQLLQKRQKDASNQQTHNLLDWLDQYQQLQDTRRKRREEIYQQDITAAEKTLQQAPAQ